MIKRTLYFGNPAYLKCRNDQLHIEIPGTDMLPQTDRSASVPVEDIGVVILDHSQITITHHLLHKLLENNCAFVTCDDRHMPLGMMLNLNGHTLQQERTEAQLSASLPLRKQLWAQTIEMKISNQAALLSARGVKTDNMAHWAASVTSGDAQNHEGRAAAYFWKNLFLPRLAFTRDPDGPAPNPFLNYGYAILRAITARSLVGSGLLPSLGIHHANRYNAYCLADDIMEPYRPFVDKVVVEMMDREPDASELNKERKMCLLAIPAMDVNIGGQQSPLMVAMQQTTASLAKCFLGESRKIIYPQF